MQNIPTQPSLHEHLPLIQIPWVEQVGSAQLPTDKARIQIRVQQQTNTRVKTLYFHFPNLILYNERWL